MALILAHGEPPPGALLQRWVALADWFVCTDGALAAALELGCTPHTVLGDMDSLRVAVPAGVELLHIAEQESTDLEKALYTAVSRGHGAAVVLGAGGRRWDQFYGNLSLFGRYADRLVIAAGDAHGWLEVVPCGARWPLIGVEVGSKVSLLPLPSADGITTGGLRWELRGERLALGERNGISNEVVDGHAWVEYEQGCLASYVVTEP
ncbi:MAG: thiamine diphosphokinase [Armatimonadetes bacterium]|nr:thiamine diphosphokinase [Armatimonadota bacterium]